MITGAVLLAAGTGRRFKSRQRKQLVYLKGRPLFLESLRTLLAHPTIKEVVVVAPQEKIRAMTRRVFANRKKGKNLIVVPGGAYRGESAKRGVLAFSIQPDVILIHDAARPLVSSSIVRRVEQAAYRHGAALAAWPLPDTLKLADPSRRVKKTVPRKNLWLAQTPQGFRSDVAYQCLTKPLKTATDDAELAERRGFKVVLVEGSPTNMKVTYRHDLAIARAISRL